MGMLKDLALGQAGSARVWRIGNFQFGFAAGEIQFKRF
jgi:hypothetical protein